MYDLHLQGIFALPCPTRDSPLVMTPGFAVHYLQGPTVTDLPPRIYDAVMQFRWLSQVTPSLGLDLGVTPGVFSDFDQSSSKAFRVSAHAATAWTWSDTAKIVLGAAYLDRPDVEAIPIGGLIWTPRNDWELDLLYPEPKIAHRIAWTGQLATTSRTGSISAPIRRRCLGHPPRRRQRRSGGVERLPLIAGMERKVNGGVSSKFEIGYVFHRRIRYSSDTPYFWPSNTVMLRGGLAY